MAKFMSTVTMVVCENGRKCLKQDKLMSVARAVMDAIKWFMKGRFMTFELFADLPQISRSALYIL